jgi:hypothetical protein
MSEQTSSATGQKKLLGIMAAVIFAGMKAEKQSYREAVEDAEMLLEYIDKEEA